MSPVTQKWGEVQQVLGVLDSEDCKETDILPDHIPSTQDIIQNGRFGRLVLRRSSGGGRIGNDLQNLPDLLRQNLYSCLRSLVDGDDVPVESSIEDLKHRISLMRLRHQADKLGLRWNPLIPWAFSRDAIHKEVRDEYARTVHPADLVADNPSDWMPYDPELCFSPWNFKDYFNTKDYIDFYRERYLEDMNIERKGLLDPVMSVAEKNESSPSKSEIFREEYENADSVDTMKLLHQSEAGDSSASFALSASGILHDTILLLKDGGNKALHEHDFHSAARRYDKAIQYGALMFMSYPSRRLAFGKDGKEASKEENCRQLQWGPLIRTLILTRLNMALLMLKPEFSLPEQALEQARLALQELKPFCVRKGKVMKGSNFDVIHHKDEPTETFTEAILLQAKAYFRIGSAHFEMGDFQGAIHGFEQSIKSTQQTDSKPDNLVLRRLCEAKRENRRKCKRRRKKFKLAFGVTDH